MYKRQDIFNKESSCKTICITGSNGKTTVTSMLEHILVGMGKKAKAGGNIGLPALELLYQDYELNFWNLRYSMAHRGEKGTDDNMKTELLITNYSINPVTPIEELLTT